MMWPPVPLALAILCAVVVALDTSPISRRYCLSKSVAAGGGLALSSLFVNNPSGAAQPPPLLSSAPTQRIEEIGGGFDLRSPPPLRYLDAVYPASVSGPWRVQRAITAVEGDKGQAEVAWRCLGGGGGYGSTADLDLFSGKRSEVYQTKFIPAPSSSNEHGYEYEFEGKIITGGVVSDRGYELASRLLRSDVSIAWEPSAPDQLSYGPVTLTVVQRSIESPTERGFGSNELYRATTPLASLTPGATVDRAIRVRRRYRRAFDEQGNRVLEGLEIVNTYRVMDGVAGVEMPTSTTKSALRLTRPAS